MTSVTAGLPVGAQDSQASPQEPPRQSYDDGMYHPGYARPTLVADHPDDLGKAETKPIAADAELDGPGSTETGMLRGTTTETMADNKAGAVKPAAHPAEGPMDLRQGHFDPPLQLISTMSTSTASSSTTSSTSSHDSMTRTTLHTTSMPTTTKASSPTSASHSSSTPVAAAHSDMTPGAQAGIVILVLSLATILIGMIYWRLHRRKQALLRTIRGEESPPSPPPTEKPNLPNPVYRFASNLYTSSTCTLVNVTEIIKGSIREKPPSTNDNVRSSSIYSGNETRPNQTRRNVFTSYQAQLWKNRAYHAASRARLASCSAVDLVAEKVSSLRGEKKPDRRSRYSNGYAFAEEFQHVPPPPPTRIQKVVASAAGLYANGSSTVRTVAASFKAQPQPPPAPPPKDTPSSTFSSMSSRNPYDDGKQNTHDFQPPCDISDNLNLVKVRSVSSGTVAMSNPADISVDALAGRISGESERTQEAVGESSPSPSQSTAPSRHSQRQSPPPAVSREGSLAHSGRAPSTQLEVPSVKMWTKQVYRVEMDFSSRSDGHLQVGEGQMVLLEQIFDDGWALCTLTDTEVQGLLPRACLSTWPIKERRHYASSSNASERAPGSTRDFSPTDSQSFRFYRQQSRPGTPKPGPESKPPSLESKPPSLKKQSTSPQQSISPQQSTSLQQSISPTLSTFFRP
ncbi:hypothetical protein CNMCM5793_003894 [Aspergillus hiratsukae]|uniref:SH3 domain-containing protein n=1 Tax=Aspergillus hiratsukae TaxID=1194566 RepID=A0A8H6QI20_9EURO|nr:hypothetical protein CNMCM5793_003894 [Aspergillus hiratsukae]KAF7172879.1 hypothetical protein CNMCM6106_006960 [Aspergillus hiratsukae]